MPSQSNSSKQDNQKSTPSSQIAPGDPSWGVDYHVSKSYGQGYDNHDPVSLLKGDTRGNKNPYGTGNAVTNFGKFGFAFDQVIIDHGQILEVPLKRQNGSRGTMTHTISIDLDPYNSGLNPNTAILGNLDSRVIDGFSCCNVDVDLATLNTGPEFSWDEPTQTLDVTFDQGVTEIILKVLVPYRTDVNSLAADVLAEELTYRVDEYQCYDMKNKGPKNKFVTLFESVLYPIPSLCAPYIKHYKTFYQVYSLPLPRLFCEQRGSAAPAINAFSSVVTPYDTDIVRKYTCGRTRTAEITQLVDYNNVYGTASCSLSQNASDSVCQLLYAYAAAKAGGGQGLPLHPPGYPSINPEGVADGEPKDWSVSTVITPSLTYYDLLKTTGDGISSNLTPFEDHTYQEYPLAKSGTGNYTLAESSKYESHEINFGHDPDDLWGAVYEQDPGGASAFTFPNKIEHVIYPTGDVFGVGDLQQHMFYEQGIVDPTVRQTPAYYMESEHPELSSYSFPMNGLVASLSTVTETVTADNPLGGPPLSSIEIMSQYRSLSSSCGAFYEHPVGGGMHHEGTGLIDKWVKPAAFPTNAVGYGENNTSTVLYNLSGIDTPDNDNATNLKGYYMSCMDHVDREIHFKFGTNPTGEEVFEYGIQNLKIQIQKDSPYSVTNHEVYQPAIAHQDRLIKHDAGAAKTFKTGDSWSGVPTGMNLLERLFAPYTTLVGGTYTTLGPIPADDVLFLSILPGLIGGGSASSGGSSPAVAGPILTTTGTPAISTVAVATIHDPADVEIDVTLANTGDRPLDITYDPIGSAIRSHGVSDMVVTQSRTRGPGVPIGTGSGNTFTLDGGEWITTHYKFSLQPAAGRSTGPGGWGVVDTGVFTMTHNYQVDRGAYLPGTTINQAEFTINVI